MTSKFLLLVLISLGTYNYTFAQNNSNIPYWVSVMENDSTANYSQAMESFNTYWAGKELPMENDENMDDERRETKIKHNKAIRERRKEEKERQEKMRTQNHQYDSEYKRFIHWKDDMLVFVRPDGTIPSMEERVKMINEQR